MVSVLLEVCKAIVAVMLDTSISEKVQSLRIDALRRVPPITDYYYRNFHNEHLVMAVCVKKIAFILEATTAREMDLILSSPKIHYNFEKVVPSNKYVIPEEEIMVWSLTSAIAPLNDEGFKRFKEVFIGVFPDFSSIFDL